MGKLKWTLDDAPANNDWQGIAYGNGLFVAVAESGTNRIMTSNDGLSWTARPAPVNKYWNGIAYGNGKFVVVGLGGSPWTMSSTDGINWTTGSVVGYTGNGFYNVAYGDGKFVAVSSEGIIVSTDGENWTTTRKVTQDSYWRDVAYGNGLFVVVANYGIYRIITSPDGITWTERHDEVDSFFSNIYNWKGITYGNGLFVVINGNMGTGYNSIITSPDGINWTVVFEEANNIWQSVAYGDGLFVISGYNKTLVSTNGVNWHREFLAEDSLFTSNICYGDEKFVVISAYGYGKIATANWPAPYNFDYGNGTEEDPYEIWTPEDLDGVRDYLEDTSIHFIQKVNIDLSGFTNWVPIGDATGSGHFSGFYDGNNFIVSNLTMIYSSFRAIGLFGSILDGSVSNLGIENININSSGTIVGAGGLAGAFHSDNRSLYKISNCYCKGTVIAENNAGLLIGIVTGPMINCWSEGTARGITYKYANAGGLVGKITSGEIHKCYSLANVEGVEVGGLIGSASPGAAIENCYAMGNVTGTRFAGGLIGNSYSPYLANCYSKGFVSLTPLVINNIGGLIGMNDSSMIVTPCYYDSDASGQSDIGKGIPKTTEEMKQQTTYIGWDFDNVWNINPLVNDGYPFLRVVGFEEPEEKYQFAYGEGIEENPYEIWTHEDLVGMYDYRLPISEYSQIEDNVTYFKQMATIDLSNYNNWAIYSMGTDYFFSINYKGNGFKIKNIKMSANEEDGDYLSFFGITSPTSILKDIRFEDYTINCCGHAETSFYISVISTFYGKIENCSAKGVINFDGLGTGVICGLALYGILINNCYSFCEVNTINVPEDSGYTVVGIAYYSFDINGNMALLENCYSVLQINGDGNFEIKGVCGGTTFASYYNSDFITPEVEVEYGGIPKTTVEMKQQSTYENWDFNDVWNINPTINDGYPYLRTEKIDIDIPTSPILELLKDIELPSHRTHLYISEEQKINLATKYGIGSLIVASGIYPETLIELDSLVNSYWEHTTKDIKLKWKQILYTNINGYIKLDNIIINDMFNYLTNEELIIGDLIQLQDNLIIPIPPLPVIEWTPSWVNGLYEELKETDDETLINDGLVEWDWYVTMDDELYKVLKNNPSLDETDEFLEASDVLSLIKKINNTIKPMN